MKPFLNGDEPVTWIRVIKRPDAPKTIVKYSEEQERDERGRFSNGGGYVALSQMQRDAGVTKENFPEHEEAVVNYTNGSGWFSTINDSLRGNYEPTEKEQETIDKYVSSLSSLIAQSPPLKEELVTYRGIRDGEFADSLRTAEVGDTFYDEGFVSTSMDRDFAGTFRDAENTGVVLEITNPVGSQGFIPMAYRTEPNPEMTQGGEKEFLLPTESSFRVTGVSGNVVKVERM